MFQIVNEYTIEISVKWQQNESFKQIQVSLLSTLIFSTVGLYIFKKKPEKTKNKNKKQKQNKKKKNLH